MKRLALLVVLAVAASIAAGAQAKNPVTVTIRHQIKGCHAWSFNGSAYKAAQTGTIKRGTTVMFTNMDVMPHKLVQVSGPAARFVGSANLSRMMASVHVIFTKPGVYKFTTKPGEDYPGIHAPATVGEDNVLTLKITVT